MPKTVTITFSEGDIKGILKSWCSMNDDLEPITIDQLFKNNEMLEYFKQEMSFCTEEVVEGSEGAIANDWLCELESYV